LAPPGDTAKPRYGYFFSVWKRQADGRFKVVLDIGSDVGAPVPSDTAGSWQALRIDPWTPPKDVSIDKEIDGLWRRESAFSESIGTMGPSSAYAEALASEFRLLENTFRPLAEKDAVVAHLKSIGARAHRRFEPRGVDVAGSADFGYAYGAYRVVAADPKAGGEQGYYAHVWRRDAAGMWRLVIEVIRPTPPA
jgi:Domain of unknown function (DUF4440)